MYDLGSRFYDPVLGRFLNADDVDVLEVQDDLYDKNLYAYCDNNPVNRVDEEGDLWQLALAGGSVGAGSSLAAIGSSIMAGIGSITPVGWVVIGTAAVVTVAAIAYSKAETSGKLKNKYTYREKSVRKMSKGGKQRIRDSGLIGLTDEEINDLYDNPGTSKEYRQRLKRDQKARDLRDKQKRNNKHRNSGKKKRKLK